MLTGVDALLYICSVYVISSSSKICVQLTSLSHDHHYPFVPNRVRDLPTTGLFFFPVGFRFVGKAIETLQKDRVVSKFKIHSSYAGRRILRGGGVGSKSCGSKKVPYKGFP